MRQNHRPHIQYATPVAPAYRRDRRVRSVRTFNIAAMTREIPKPTSPARGVLIALPISLALWAGVGFGVASWF